MGATVHLLPPRSRVLSLRGPSMAACAPQGRIFALGRGPLLTPGALTPTVEGARRARVTAPTLIGPRQTREAARHAPVTSRTEAHALPIRHVFL